jgi:hypothetical protein
MLSSSPIHDEAVNNMLDFGFALSPAVAIFPPFCFFAGILLMLRHVLGVLGFIIGRIKSFGFDGL